MSINKIEISPGLLRRFWAKVDKTPGHGPRGKCWPWTGCKSSQGYGWIHAGRHNGKPVKVSAHRLSYTIHNGSIPDGVDVLHECDYPPCCNPDCLFPGTQDDNMKDAARKGRTSRGERNPNHQLTDDTVLEARRLYAAGATFTALRKRYKRPHSLIHGAVTGKFWKHLPGAVKSRGYSRKLTDSQVAEMRRLYAAGGLRYQDLGERYGVGPECAGDAITGRTFKHIPGAVPPPYSTRRRTQLDRH